MKDKRPSWAPWAVAVFCLAVWASFLPTLIDNQLIYGDDSASYVECARSLLGGHGCQMRVHSGLEPVSWIPMGLWQPGYPILLALGQLAGLPEFSSALMVSLGSMVVFAFCVVWITWRMLGAATALGVGLATLCMPPFFQASIQAMSESPYMALTLITLVMLIAWALGEKRSRWWLLGAGIAAGLAWGVRYVAVSLIASASLWLIGSVAAKRRTGWSDVAAWGTGVLVGAGPFALRNMGLFGKIIPYSMDPSELSLWQNIQHASATIVRDLSAWHSSHAILLNSEVLVAVFLAAAGTLLLIVWRPWKLGDERLRALFQERPETLLTLYGLAYTAMIIIARTKYKWGTYIDSRSFVPVYWLFWIALAATGLSILHRWRVSERLKAVLLLGVLVTVTGLQLRLHQAFVRDLIAAPSGLRRNVVDYAFGRRGAEYLAREVAEDQIVLATRAFVLRIFQDINARQLIPAYKTENPLTWREIQQAGDKGFLWGIVIDNPRQAKEGVFGELIQRMAMRPETFTEFERVRIDSPAIILKYVGS